MRLPPERLFLYLPFLSDKRPVSRGQLVLVFCTLLDDLNALVTWRSHSSPAAWKSAPGFPRPAAHRALSHGVCTGVARTRGDKHAPLISRLPAKLSPGWQLNSKRSLIHPQQREVKCGAGGAERGWTGTATLMWGVTVSCQPLVGVLF